MTLNDRHCTNNRGFILVSHTNGSFPTLSKVWEETGFDVGDRINEEDYVEQTIKDQRIRLYIIKGVSESTVFEPQTRKEISVSLLIGFRARVVCT